MNARQAVEEALDTVQKSLAALSGAALRAAFDPKLAEGIRDVENRRRRLVTLPEMPMRTTEAQEIQQILATIEHDLRSAPSDLQDACLLSYTDPSLSAGEPIKAAHVQELRNGTK